MKKLALSAVLGASLMVSTSAFALTAMNDAGMKSATGQAGVSIAIDNVKIEQYVGSTTYTDASGAYGAGDSGSIVIGSKHTVKEFLALTSAVDFKTDFSAAMGITYVAPVAAVAAVPAVLGDNPATTGVVETDFVITPAVAAVAAVAEVTGTRAAWFKASALSIDVGTCKVLSAGLAANNADATLTAATLTAKGCTSDEITTILGSRLMNNTNVAGVVIGLPTLLIKTTADTYDVGVASGTALNNGKKYIQISKGDSAMAILGGQVEIAAH